MKLLVILAVAGFVAGEAPYPSSGWKPTGGLLVLPSKQQEQQANPAQQYGPPAQQYGPPAQQYGAPQPRDNQDKTSELERLKQQEGSDSGIYHVLLPDGRLQKIEYATAPLKEIETKEQSSKQQEEPAKVWPVNLAQNYQQQSRYYQQEQSAANFQSQQFSRQQEEPAKTWPVSFAQNGQQQRNDYRGEHQSAANFQSPKQQEEPAKAWSVSFAQNGQQQQASANYEQAQFSKQETLPSPGFPVRYVEIQPNQANAQKQQQQDKSRAFGASESRPQYSREDSVKVEPQRIMMVMPQPMTYVASIQYKDVEPINPPVYAYNNGASPLVRIIRK